jgi:6-phosphofructokinase 1
MAETSTKVFIYEAMGRHAGWLAAAAGWRRHAGAGAAHHPVPERAYDEAAFLARVKAVVERVGYCVVVARRHPRRAWPLRRRAGGGKDAFGHAQLGGVAAHLAGRVKDELGLKTLGRARLPATLGPPHGLEDRLGAGAGGRQGRGETGAGRPNATMPVIVRTSDAPYRWKIEAAPLSQGRQPREETAGRFHPPRRLRHHRGVTSAPLIRGEAPLPYGRDGLPAYGDAGGGAAHAAGLAEIGRIQEPHRPSTACSSA